MRHDTDDYCEVLQHELDQRTKRNAAYSLRAFARHLDMSVSFLSEMLRGQKRLTEKRAFTVAERLGLDGQDTRLFTTLVRYKHARDARAREAIGTELAQIRGSRLRFEPVESEWIRQNFVWHHSAVHELAARDDFDRDPSWIARQLDIGVDEAAAAVDQLISVGMLREQEGRLAPATPNVVFRKPDPDAIQRYHRCMLDKARGCVGRPSAEAEFSSILMAFDPDTLPQAVDLIRRFQAEMAELSLRSPKRRLYQLGVQLHPIDRD